LEESGGVISREKTGITLNFKGGSMEIVISIGMAIAVSLIIFMGKLQGGQAFDPQKFIRTLIVGLIVGVSAKGSGIDITTENWPELLAASSGIIAVSDQLLKILMFWLKKAIK